MSKKIFTTLFSVLTLAAAFATTNKTPMNIKITVKGLENSTMILANYYGDKQYVKDTLQLDKKGSITLKQDTTYPGGVYLAVFPALGNRYFEFIISESAFSLETDSNDLTGHIKVSNSIENTLFYDDMKFLAHMKTTSDSLAKLYRAAKDQNEKDKYMNELKKIDTEVKGKRNEVMTKYPNLFYAKLLKSMKEIDVPDAPRKPDGSMVDSAFQWRFYKAHYWDFVDLGDERLLRTPVFHNKLKTFMNQTVVQMPDSLITASEDLLSKTDKKNDVYRYILTYIFNEMANSKVMGYDAVYQYLGEHYFCVQSLTPWIDTAKRFKICDRATRLKPVLVGKPAQRLILPTDSTEMQWRSLQDVKAKYTILAFWDPDCGHCKKEIPVLVEAYHNLKKKGIDVQGYSPAIMEIENYKDWVEFIQKNNLDWINVCDAKRHSNFRFEWDIQSTPQIYILDKDKIIRARRIGADQVEDYILHLENPAYRGKLPTKVNDDDKQEGTE